MRAFSMGQQRIEQDRIPRFCREDMPGAALWLLLYALGVSCGLAFGNEEDAVRLFSALPAALSDAIRQKSMVRVLLCAMFASISQSSLVLLSGLSGWLFPLWMPAVLLRSIAVGVCAAMCQGALQTGVDCALPMTVMMTAGFAASFWWEMRLGIFPLRYWRRKPADDARYLSVGMSLVLRYVLISLFFTAVGLWLFLQICAFD